MTDSQSPADVCRKSRIVGYHGLSARFSIQRHSGGNGRSSQTGLPIAPAKCATAVSHADDQVEIRDQGGGLGKIRQQTGPIR